MKKNLTLKFTRKSKLTSWCGDHAYKINGYIFAMNDKKWLYDRRKIKEMKMKILDCIFK